MSIMAVHLEDYGGASSGLWRGVLLHVGGHARSDVGRSSQIQIWHGGGGGGSPVACDWRSRRGGGDEHRDLAAQGHGGQPVGPQC